MVAIVTSNNLSLTVGQCAKQIAADDLVVADLIGLSKSGRCATFKPLRRHVPAGIAVGSASLCGQRLPSL